MENVRVTYQVGWLQIDLDELLRAINEICLHPVMESIGRAQKNTPLQRIATDLIRQWPDKVIQRLLTSNINLKIHGTELWLAYCPTDTPEQYEVMVMRCVEIPDRRNTISFVAHLPEGHSFNDLFDLVRSQDFVKDWMLPEEWRVFGDMKIQPNEGA